MDDARESEAPATQLSLASLGPPIAVGRTAEVFALDERRVIKVLLPAFPSTIADHEAGVATIVAGVYPGAPRFLGTVIVEGRRGLIYERVDGPTMDAFVRGHLWQARRLGRLLGELHASMHRADGTGLADQLDGLRAAIERAAPELPPGAREAALARADGLPRGTSVCHGDLHPANVILGADRPVIIDWGNARIGSPAADVARSVYLMRDTPMHESPILRPLVGSLRARFVDAYLARYRKLRPLDAAELGSWRLPILAARLAEQIEDERVALRLAIVREFARAVGPP